MRPSRPPKLARFLLRILARPRDRAYLGDVEEIFRLRAESGEGGGAGRWYRREAVRSLPSFALESVRWSAIMFKSHLKSAVRLLSRDRGYSLLKVAGLALGLACFALLTLWVRSEVGWDRFHENGRLIYRLESDTPVQPAPLVPYLKANYPEVAEGTRLFFPGPLTVARGDRVFEEDGFLLADPAVFDVFTVPFAAGNRTSALREPNTVVLTEAAARKYFVTADPLGAVLTVENRFQVRVAGVVRNMPRNSDIQFNVLGEFRMTGLFRKGYETHWGNHEYASYVRLAPGVKARLFIPKIARTVLDHEPGLPEPLTLVPLFRIHLYEDGAIGYVTVFGLVAVFILAIAGCNFITLTTARCGQRAKEIAVRKVAGANRRQLVHQFLAESVLLSLAALPVAMAAVSLALPSFNGVTGKGFVFSDLLAPGLMLPFLGTAVAVGILAGGLLGHEDLAPGVRLQDGHPALDIRGFGGFGPGHRTADGQPPVLQGCPRGPGERPEVRIGPRSHLRNLSPAGSSSAGSFPPVLRDVARFWD